MKGGMEYCDLSDMAGLFYHSGCGLCSLTECKVPQHMEGLRRKHYSSPPFCSQYAHFLNDLSFIIYSAAFSYYEVALQFCVLLAVLIGFQDLKQQLQILNEFTCRCGRNGRKITRCSSLTIMLCF